MSTYKLICAHCRQRLRIRTSEGLSPLLRIAYLQCTNEACGWTARAVFEITHEMSASSMPNKAVYLPLADSAIRNQALSSISAANSAASKTADLFSGEADHIEHDLAMGSIRPFENKECTNEKSA